MGKRWEKVAFAQPSYKMGVYDNVANIERCRRRRRVRKYHMEIFWIAGRQLGARRLWEDPIARTKRPEPNEPNICNCDSCVFSLRSHFLSKRRSSRNVWNVFLEKSLGHGTRLDPALREKHKANLPLKFTLSCGTTTARDRTYAWYVLWRVPQRGLSYVSTSSAMRRCACFPNYLSIRCQKGRGAKICLVFICWKFRLLHSHQPSAMGTSLGSRR